jgi:hypothetical protein
MKPQMSTDKHEIQSRLCGWIYRMNTIKKKLDARIFNLS